MKGLKELWGSLTSSALWFPILLPLPHPIADMGQLVRQRGIPLFVLTDEVKTGPLKNTEFFSFFQSIHIFGEKYGKNRNVNSKVEVVTDNISKHSFSVFSAHMCTGTYVFIDVCVSYVLAPFLTVTP